MSKSQKKLDMAAIRTAPTNQIEIPYWLKVEQFAYWTASRCHVKVLDILGTKVRVVFQGKTKSIPRAELEPPRTDLETTEIELGLINHPTYRSIATDYAGDLSAIKILEGNEALLVPLPNNLHPHLRSALEASRIKQFYSHQLQAWDVLSQGGSLAIVTPTASGKSMAFIPWAFQLRLTQHKTTLLIYPLRALAADQEAKLKAINEALPPESRLTIVRCTGDIPLQIRQQYFESGRECPDLVIASPDVLHHQLFHTNTSKMVLWRKFLERLSLVVADESHTYTSSFGIHFANLLRRLRLAIFKASGNPDSLSWVVATATIANPVELASTFTGLPFDRITLIDKSGAKIEERTFTIFKPIPSPNFTTAALIRTLLGYGVKGLVFVNSRHTAKRIFSILQMQMEGTMYGVDIFYGSLTSNSRSRLIDRLSNGSLRILIATSALEAGLDLPSLDFVILRGTSSINSLWQRAGRAGRASPGLVMLVPDSNNHIDYYYGTSPERLFEKAEMVKVQPNYPNIVARHLLCAAAEGGIHNSLVPNLFGSNSEYIAAELLKQEQLFWSRRGVLSKKGYPHREVSLRGIVDARIQLIDSGSGEMFEEMSLNQAHRECHTGAIYISSEEGTTVAWRCKELLGQEQKAVLERMSRSDLRTWPEVEMSVRPLKQLDNPKVVRTALAQGNIRLSLWWGTISSQISGYKEVQLDYGPTCLNSSCIEHKATQPRQSLVCPSCGAKLTKTLIEKELGQTEFEEPLITSYEAPILRIEVNELLASAITDAVPKIRQILLKTHEGRKKEIPPIARAIFESKPVPLALHSLSHMLIKAIPLLFLASDKDVNSLTENRTANGSGKKGNADSTVVYLYDSVASGCGTSEAIFNDIELVGEKALELARICDCHEIGCPRCLTIHGCPEMNEGLSKLLGLWLLEVINIGMIP